MGEGRSFHFPLSSSTVPLGVGWGRGWGLFWLREWPSLSSFHYHLHRMEPRGGMRLVMPGGCLYLESKVRAWYELWPSLELSMQQLQAQLGPRQTWIHSKFGHSFIQHLISWKYIIVSGIISCILLSIMCHTKISLFRTRCKQLFFSFALLTSYVRPYR